MCTVSRIMQSGIGDWPPFLPSTTYSAGPSRLEFDELVVYVKRLEQAMIDAKLIDEEEGNPDCENQEKINTLQKLADEYGIEISFP